MRALPLIEMVLGATLALVVAIGVLFLIAWHVRWRAMFAAPELTARAVAMPAYAEVQAAVDAGFHDWCVDASRVGRRLSYDTLTGSLVYTLVTRHHAPIENEPPGGLWSGQSGYRQFAEYTVCEPLDTRLTEQLGVLLDQGLRLGQMPPPPDADHPWPGHAEPPSWDQDLCLRAAACWFAQVAAAPDPSGENPLSARQPLDALDALAAAIGPQSQRGWTAWCFALRDAAYLKAQLAGTLSAGRLAHWRDGGDWRAPLFMRLEYERRWTIFDEARRFAGSPWASTAYAPSFAATPQILSAWWAIPDDCRSTCAPLVSEAKAIDDGTPATTAEYEREEEVLTMMARHRFALVASAIAETWMTTGKTPDEVPPDLAAGPGRPALVIRKWDDHDWRITCAAGQNSGHFSGEMQEMAEMGRLAIRRFPMDLPAPAFAWDEWQLIVRLRTPPPEPRRTWNARPKPPMDLPITNDVAP